MRALARLHERLLAACGAVAALSIAFIAVGVSLDVVMRNAGIGGISWMLEASEYGLFIGTFLGAPWALRLGAHVRVDVLIDGLPPRARRAADLFADVIGLAVSAVILHYSVRVAAAAYHHGARMIKDLIFPEWYLYALIAFSAMLLCIEFVHRIAILVRNPELSGAGAAKADL